MNQSQQTTDAVPGPRPGDVQQPIPALRARIDAIDAEIIRLWRERAGISRDVGSARLAAGGTRLMLSREMEIHRRFCDALGSDGALLASLLLRAGRGPL
jgi:chorismate mutase